MEKPTQTKIEAKGLWTPMELITASDLTLYEDRMLSIIWHLDVINTPGCWAQNEYFQKFFKGVKVPRISKIISSLKKKKHIDITYIYKPGSKEVDVRYMKVISPLLVTEYRRQNDKYLSGTPLSSEERPPFPRGKDIVYSIEKEEEERKKVKEKKEGDEANASTAASPGGSLHTPIDLSPSDSNGSEMGEVNPPQPPASIPKTKKFDLQDKVRKSFPARTTQKHFDVADAACDFFEQWVGKYNNDLVQKTVKRISHGGVTKRVAFLMRQGKLGVTLDEMKGAIAWKCERMAGYEFWHNIKAQTILQSKFRESIENAEEDGWIIDGKFVDKTKMSSAEAVPGVLDKTSKIYLKRFGDLFANSSSGINTIEEAEKYLEEEFNRNGHL